MSQIWLLTRYIPKHWRWGWSSVDLGRQTGGLGSDLPSGKAKGGFLLFSYSNSETIKTKGLKMIVSDEAE